ncbi:hypothetical protein [Listeria ilorinensis]|uniref:hypothetical protein n=1 Tax=Listeria ilorinensis TaxID=2867439 RepID=UPI001EF5E6B9|nr:hypothetical protein [Listeria ilorinensis]
MKIKLMGLLIMWLFLVVGCTDLHSSEKEKLADETVFTGTVEEVIPDSSILVKDFKDVENQADPDNQLVRLFRTTDVIFNEKDEPVKVTQLKKGDRVEVFLTTDYVVKETSPGQIDWEYIVKIRKRD